MFKKLCCWFAGHNWETVQTYRINVSPLGHGFLRYCKCSRCGEEQTKFESIVTIGNNSNTQKPEHIRPSCSRTLTSIDEITSYEDTKENNENKNKKPRCKAGVSAKEVPNTTSSSESEVQGV